HLRVVFFAAQPAEDQPGRAVFRIDIIGGHLCRCSFSRPVRRRPGFLEVTIALQGAFFTAAYLTVFNIQYRCLVSIGYYVIGDMRWLERSWCLGRRAMWAGPWWRSCWRRASRSGRRPVRARRRTAPRA